MAKKDLIERRLVPGYDTYNISMTGEIRSVLREVGLPNGHKRMVGGKIITIRTVIGAGGTRNRLVSLNRNGHISTYSVVNLLKAAWPELFQPVTTRPGEIWKPVQGYPRYEVSTHGRVKELGYKTKSSIVEYYEPERLLAVYVQNSDGRYVSLAHGKPGEKIHSRATVSINRLVFEVFKGPIPAGYYIKPKDGNVENHSPDNLYVAHSSGQSY